jgi:hypothetical protein
VGVVLHHDENRIVHEAANGGAPVYAQILASKFDNPVVYGRYVVNKKASQVIQHIGTFRPELHEAFDSDPVAAAYMARLVQHWSERAAASSPSA